jgi:hypothetical protein
MGPRPFRHGYEESAQETGIAEKTVSMGPRPFRHGYRGTFMAAMHIEKIAFFTRLLYWISIF